MTPAPEPAATVTAVAGLLTAITATLWPVIVVGVLIAFRRPARRALDRISTGDGTIEVFGVKVNVGKATEEQQRLIEDLQRQVATLRNAVRLIGEIGPPGRTGGGFLNPSTLAGRPLTPSIPTFATWPPPAPAMVAPPSAMAAPSVADAPAAAEPGIAAGTGGAAFPAPPRRSPRPRLLWVDDQPDNVALLRASLRRRGFVIIEASSTDAALAAFVPGGFDAVISDLGRDTPDAGVTLTADLRVLDDGVPIFIFSISGAVAVYGARARQAGATLTTDSATVLMEALLELQSLG